MPQGQACGSASGFKTMFCLGHVRFNAIQLK